MSKLFYLFAIMMLATGAYSYAEEEHMCPEGQVYDADSGTCMDAPAEESSSEDAK